MLKFEQAVMNKPDWKEKINDKEIVAKWKKEASEQEVREEVFDYAIQELKWLSTLGDVVTGIEPTGVDLVWVVFTDPASIFTDLFAEIG